MAFRKRVDPDSFALRVNEIGGLAMLPSSRLAAILTVCLAAGCHDAAPTKPSLPTPANPPAAVPVVQPEAAPPAELREITFDDLRLQGLRPPERELRWYEGRPGLRQYDPSMLTPEIESLGGRLVSIRGHMSPWTAADRPGITKFLLVSDARWGSPGQAAPIDEMVFVALQDGQSISFCNDPIVVDGTFKVEELDNPLEPEGAPMAIYKIERAVVHRPDGDRG